MCSIIINIDQYNFKINVKFMLMITNFMLLKKNEYR
jgi:hypothetical protein